MTRECAGQPPFDGGPRAPSAGRSRADAQSARGSKMNHPSYWLSRWLAATPEMGNALHDGPGQRHDQQQRGSDAPPGQSNTHACALYTLQPLLHTRSGWRATLEMVMRGDTNAGLNSESSQVPAGLGVAVIRGVSAALPLAMATTVSGSSGPDSRNMWYCLPSSRGPSSSSVWMTSPTRRSVSEPASRRAAASSSVKVTGSFDTGCGAYGPGTRCSFRPRRPGRASSPPPPGGRVHGPLEVGQLGDHRRPQQLIVGRGDRADALLG